MSSKHNLRLNWCSHAAAKYAMEHWHYSKCMPAGKTVKIGVWEDGAFIGAIIFSKGAAPQSHCPYGITNTEICELTRVSLRSDHKCAVTRVVAIGIRMLRKQSPGLRLIVSYADPAHGHHGGIYAGGGWTYTGETAPCTHYVFVATGEAAHSKTLATGRKGYVTALRKANKIRPIKTTKYKYLMPLDNEMRAQVEALSKPYIKCAGSIAGDARVIPGTTEGGSIPTPALIGNPDG